MKMRANISEDQILTIYLEGAIDSATAPEAETQLMEIYQAHTAKAVVLDAEELRYISSSGLRVLLKLRKLEQNLQRVNRQTMPNNSSISFGVCTRLWVLVW